MSEIIRNLVDNIINDNQAAAQENFNDALATKITDALDQRKIEIAQSMGANQDVEV